MGYTIIIIIFSTILGALLKDYLYDFFCIGNNTENKVKIDEQEQSKSKDDNVTVDDMVIHDMVNEQDEWDIGEVNFND